MALNISTERVRDDLLFTHTEDDKFNIEAIVVRFITPLDEIRSQRYTALVSLLAESCRKYPDKADLAKKLTALYGASLHSFSYRTGNYLVAGLAINGIGDKYTLDNETITTECAQLLLDCIFDPDIKDGKFRESYFEQKKHELIDKIKSAFNNRHNYAVSRARDIAFSGEPSAIAPLGTEENAEKLTSSILADSYRELLEESVISISFCGAGNNIAAQRMIRDRFEEHIGSRKSSVRRINDLNAFSPIKDEPKYVNEEIDQAQSKLVMFFKTNGRNIYADKLACAMYGGTPFSKLFINVREKLSLCYYCQSAIVECKGAMLVDSGVEPGNEQKAQDEILNQLDALRSGDFTDDDIENTKKYLTGAIRANYDSYEDLNSWYFFQFARGTNDSPNDAIDNIEALTREDVVEAAKSFVLDTVYTLTPSGGESDA